MATPGTPPGVFLFFPKTVTQFDGTSFSVDPRYQIRCHVGHGAQGIICSAVDMQSPTSAEIAVKKIPNALDETIASKRLLRELRLLRNLKHPNILSVIDVMLPPSTNVLLWKDVYMVSELMDTDLNYVIESGQTITTEHVQCFTYQLLCGISYIHSYNVVHRDLKPGNVLVDQNCQLKICDFGLARSCANGSERDSDSQQLLTMYVTTRWYRAPELLCFNVTYGSPVDMWSVGCILAELLGRQPLFKGSDPRHQLAEIVRVLGRPNEEDMASMVNEGAASYFDTLDAQPAAIEPLEERLQGADEAAIDLLRQLLAFNPHKRATADTALTHRFLAPFYHASAHASASPEDQSRINAELRNIAGASALPKEQLQNLIFQEMLHYHPEVMNLHWGAAQPA